MHASRIFCCFACVRDALTVQYSRWTQLPSVCTRCVLSPCVPVPKRSRQGQAGFSQSTSYCSAHCSTQLPITLLCLLLKYSHLPGWVLGAARRKGKSILSQECGVKPFSCLLCLALPWPLINSRGVQDWCGICSHLEAQCFELRIIYWATFCLLMND